jgi:hypothetical protein
MNHLKNGHHHLGLEEALWPKGIREHLAAAAAVDL